jgi:succinoglycan biosynthesis transport protein ExoP
MESVQQQSFPITEARVISAATRPLSKSSPKTMLILTLATMVGFGFGIVAAIWRDLADRVFRTGNQVETLLQAECIALIPVVNDEAQETKNTDPGDKVKSMGQGREVQIAKNVKPDAGRQIIIPTVGLYSTIVESPFSAFAEAIRSIKVAIDLSPKATGGRIIGFTSSVPNEGKSSIAAAVARLMAQTGARTLLVDCDLRNPSLSRLLSPRATGGLIEVLRGQSTPEAAIWSDHATNMSFLPATMKARLAHSSEVLASAQTRKFFDSLRNTYEYIIVDLAPLMPIVDVRAATNLVDSYVYVVAWGQTRTDFVEQALRSAKGVYEHLLGVVLNKVDLKTIGRFDRRGDSYYHHVDYDRYGYAE